MSDFICPEGAVGIPLSGKLGEGLWVIVDADDAERFSLKDTPWRASSGYAVRYVQQSGKTTVVSMHRVILEAEHGICVDHINGDIRDNRRANLRFATHSENMRNRKMAKHNRSGFKGVYLGRPSDNKPYRAEIKHGGKKYHLGSFPTPEEAHEAYREASQRLHGEFSRTL